MLTTPAFVQLHTEQRWAAPAPSALMALEGPQIGDDIRSAVVVAPASELVPWCALPARSKHDGPRRLPATARLAALVRGIVAGEVDLPGMVALNLRDARAKAFEVLPGGHPRLRLERSPLVVVDGHLRLKALAKAAAEGAKIDRLRIVALVALGAPRAAEVALFDRLNGHVRKSPVPVLGDRPSWMGAVEELVDLLEALPIWTGRIANDTTGHLPPGATISRRAMAESLRAVLKTPLFRRIPLAQQAAILDAYWRGIASILPDAFDEARGYCLLKAIGVGAMHELLVAVIEHLRIRGLALELPASYEALLKDPLERRLRATNGRGEEVRGIAVWRTGADGAAGTLGGNAGRKSLAAKIETLLQPAQPGGLFAD